MTLSVTFHPSPPAGVSSHLTRVPREFPPAAPARRPLSASRRAAGSGAKRLGLAVAVPPPSHRPRARRAGAASLGAGARRAQVLP